MIFRQKMVSRRGVSCHQARRCDKNDKKAQTSVTIASRHMSSEIRMPVPEALLFQRLRWRLWRNTLHALLRGSLVLGITILLCSVLVWGSLFAVSYLGFRELKERWNIPLDLRVIRLVLDPL